MSNLIDRLIEGRKGAQKALPDDEARTKYPNLWAFMTRVQAGEGYEKDLASVSIRLGFGEWMVDLSDPSLELSVTASSKTLDGAMEAMEAILASPCPPIRPWKGSTGKLRKLKKEKPRQESGEV